MSSPATKVTGEAISRANERLRSTAYGYGHLGDSIERRFNGFNYPFGGQDAHSGWSYSSLPGLGGGGYYGPGLPYGERGAGPHEAGSCGGPFTFLQRFSGKSAFAHHVIGQCILAYLNYGIVKNIVELFADFATQGLEITHEDESVENFYKIWRMKVDLDNRIHRIHTDYFVTGNVFIYRVNAKLTDKEKRDMKRNKGSYEIIDNSIILRRPAKLKDENICPSVQLDPTLLAFRESVSALKALAKQGKVTALSKPPGEFDIPENVEKLIPWDYISLNPLQIEPRGRKFRGENYWAFGLTEDDKKDILENLTTFRFRKDISTTEINLPKEFQERLQPYAGMNRGTYTAEVILDSENMTVIQDRKFDYWDWAVPMIWPALRHLAFKDILTSMDCKVARSVINTVTLWKLGNKEKGIYPEDEMFERLADMLQQDGNAMNIIWNQDIEAQVVEPNLSRVFDPKKYEAANRDIMVAFGMPEVLLGGPGSNFSNSFIGVAGILERVQTARDAVEKWLMKELKIIADAMGFRKLPQIKWTHTNLKDIKTEQQMAIQLFDRGIYSAESTLKHFGEDISIEIERQRRERDIAETNGKSVMEKRGPFNRPEETLKVGITPINWGDEATEAIRKTNELKKPTNIQENTNGRPPGSQDKQKREQKTTSPPGQNLIGVLNEYNEIFNNARAKLSSIESVISKIVLDLREVKYIKQLSAEDKDKIETFSFAVLGQYEANEEVSEELVNKKLKESGGEVVSNLLSLYRLKLASEDINKLTKEQKMDIFASAYAMYIMGSIERG